MTYSNLIEPISPKESPTEFPDASVDEDDNTDGDINRLLRRVRLLFPKTVIIFIALL